MKTFISILALLALTACGIDIPFIPGI